MKLAIISHTEHYKTTDGTLVGWGPTITEINKLLQVFDTIYHVAMLHEGEAPKSALPYISDRVVFVSVPALGGRTLKAKSQLIIQAPKVLRIINGVLTQVDWFQFRGPTGIGVYVIPFLVLCVKKPGWFKYAGNWSQERPPLGYKLQRFMMRNQSRTVTINGRWANQPQQCLSFENPCLTDIELVEGAALAQQKSISGSITFCYVGRLEAEKGVERIIQAISGLTESAKKRIQVVHLVGDGRDKRHFESLADQSGVPFIFHGFLSRTDVFEIYKKSQVFLMPTTASEGFPKVIAEAMNYGCLPVVSDISAIGQYITHMETGICLKEVTCSELKVAIEQILQMNIMLYQEIVRNQRRVVKLFSFNHYNKRIKTEIII
ncbi:glycosyltransferase [Bizionia hallyeonensis]|uniref:Glycosyltransferase n=1 Tax=Bizionia hallyeonensis TaxID=1123757 RepID=A0ABW0C894_9FLAO